jgi:hypothetical protein
LCSQANWPTDPAQQKNGAAQADGEILRTSNWLFCKALNARIFLFFHLVIFSAQDDRHWLPCLQQFVSQWMASLFVVLPRGIRDGGSQKVLRVL